MQLRITPVRPIGEIQKDFNAMFPYLKLEFFHNKVYQQPDFTPQQIVSRQQRIGNMQANRADGVIDLKPEMKVKELEKLFKDDFSLSVQVFRRSGNVWLQTTITDEWTLGQQNEHGKEISASATKMNGTADYDLSRDSEH